MYLGLGANVGDRKGNIEQSCTYLRDVLRSLKRAAYYESQAMYHRAQADFLNTVVVGYTLLSPWQLLRRVQALEIFLGRKRTQRYGPRSIDIDILLYAQCCINSPHLCIPHPRMYERPFVLHPLKELAPDLRDPRSGIYFRSFLKKLPSVEP